MSAAFLLVAITLGLNALSPVDCWELDIIIPDDFAIKYDYSTRTKNAGSLTVLGGSIWNYVGYGEKLHGERDIKFSAGRLKRTKPASLGKLNRTSIFVIAHTSHFQVNPGARMGT